MPRWLQILLQVASTAVGGYLSFHAGTPLPSVIAGGVQAAIGGVAQSYNTDGTGQQVAYVPKTN